jgi:hypothetical protein
MEPPRGGTRGAVKKKTSHVEAARGSVKNVTTVGCTTAFKLPDLSEALDDQVSYMHRSFY